MRLKRCILLFIMSLSGIVFAVDYNNDLNEVVGNGNLTKEDVAKEINEIDPEKLKFGDFKKFTGIGYTNGVIDYNNGGRDISISNYFNKDYVLREFHALDIKNNYDEMPANKLISKDKFKEIIKEDLDTFMSSDGEIKERYIGTVKDPHYDNDAANLRTVLKYRNELIPYINNKANKDASNLTDKDINNWKNKLGIDGFDTTAVATLPQVSGDKRVSIGVAGSYNSSKNFGFAIGLSGQNKNKNLIYKINAGIYPKKQWSIGAGFNYSFGEIKNENNVYKLENQKLKEKLADNDLKIQDLNNKIKQLENKFEKLADIKNTNISIQTKLITGFNTSEYKLTNSQIIEIEEFLKTVDVNKSIEIIGYTDIRGNDKFNLDLGYKRAEQVAAILINSGYKVESIKSSGFNTIVNNKENFENRRVEINVK